MNFAKLNRGLTYATIKVLINKVNTLFSTMFPKIPKCASCGNDVTAWVDGYRDRHPKLNANIDLIEFLVR